ELEAQRNFVARIIASLPVGLYVIDRGYRIRAWNRKREAGTQGVSREDALGREVFEVLDRQPRELLKLEFDRVFATGEIQTVEMDSQTTGEAGHYRITKIPMRLDDEDISHVITIGEDVTAWRQAQQRLAQSEKLAAGGQMAHDRAAARKGPAAVPGGCRAARAVLHGAHAQRDGCDEFAWRAHGADQIESQPSRRNPRGVHRHGYRDPAGGLAQDLRAVFHNQAAGPGHGVGSLGGLRYRGGA